MKNLPRGKRKGQQKESYTGKNHHPIPSGIPPIRLPTDSDVSSGIPMTFIRIPDGFRREFRRFMGIPDELYSISSGIPVKHPNFRCFTLGMLTFHRNSRWIILYLIGNSAKTSEFPLFCIGNSDVSTELPTFQQNSRWRTTELLSKRRKFRWKTTGIPMKRREFPQSVYPLIPMFHREFRWSPSGIPMFHQLLLLLYYTIVTTAQIQFQLGKGDIEKYRFVCMEIYMNNGNTY